MRGMVPEISGEVRQVHVNAAAALVAFLKEHQHCGDLDGGVEGDRVWMTCSCGAAINRDADRD